MKSVPVSPPLLTHTFKKKNSVPEGHRDTNKGGHKCPGD